MMLPTNEHTSVMLTEAIDSLSIKPNKWYIDGTFGRGGHTAAILEKGGKVLALDWDEEAISSGMIRFNHQIEKKQLIIKRESFSKLQAVASEALSQQVSGILFDFGTSTNQLMSGDRGFSFLEDGELDMRMDDRLGVKAKDILALIPEKQLADMFYNYGGEEDSRKIARAIKQSKLPITTTQQLASLVATVKKGRTGKLHPATKVFQALRIAVNSELDEIESALPQALAVLGPSGVIVTISFHEGEDRIVKNQFRSWEEAGHGIQLTDKPLTPSEQEVQTNPRSRSAKLRIFKKQL